MADRFRLTLAQLNATVGDIAGNAAMAKDAWEAGRAAKSDMVALPEMFITGYNTQDLMSLPTSFSFCSHPGCPNVALPLCESLGNLVSWPAPDNLVFPLSAFHRRGLCGSTLSNRCRKGFGPWLTASD